MCISLGKLKKKNRWRASFDTAGSLEHFQLELLHPVEFPIKSKSDIETKKSFVNYSMCHRITLQRTARHQFIANRVQYFHSKRFLQFNMKSFINTASSNAKQLYNEKKIKTMWTQEAQLTRQLLRHQDNFQFRIWVCLGPIRFAHHICLPTSLYKWRLISTSTLVIALSIMPSFSGFSLNNTPQPTRFLEDQS